MTPYRATNEPKTDDGKNNFQSKYIYVALKPILAPEDIYIPYVWTTQKNQRKTGEWFNRRNIKSVSR